MIPELLTPIEVADRLRVSIRWVYSHHHQLGSIKVGGFVRVPVDGLLAYLDRAAHSSRSALRVPINKKALVARSMAEARESFRERNAGNGRKG